VRETVHQSGRLEGGCPEALLVGQHSGIETMVLGTKRMVMRADDILGILFPPAQAAREVA
jgi:co-chaperonin GroES (HSP10)